MDASAYYYYYYNNFYNYTGEIASYEASQIPNNGQIVGYEGQPNLYTSEVPSNEVTQIASDGQISGLGEQSSNVYNQQLTSYETYQVPDDGYGTNPTLYDHQLNSFEAEDEDGSIPLPKELTNMFKPLECELCEVTVACPASAFTHYEGKTHIKNVNAYMKEHYNVYGSLKLRKERFNPVKCDICNIELTSKVVYQQHLSGKQHLKNLKKKQYSDLGASMNDIFTNGDDSSLNLPPPPVPPKLSDFVCEICNITTNTESQLQLHKNGQKHKKKLIKFRESQLDNALNAFYNGEMPEGYSGEMPQGYSGDTNNNITETQTFVENPDMDYPLEFDSNIETYDDTSYNENETDIGAETEENNNVATPEPAQINCILPFNLGERIDEVSTDLGTNKKKVLSSTGILIRQLSAVSQLMNNEVSHVTDDNNNANNCSEAVISEQNSNNGENIVSDNSKIEDSSNNNSVSVSEKTAEELGNINHCNNHIELNVSGEKDKNSKKTTDIPDQLYTDKKLENQFSNTKDSINTQDIQNTEENSQNDENLKHENKNQQPAVTKAVKNNTKFDQQITKLAIEEIEKESTNFEKMRALPSTDNMKKTDEKSNYKYDKAGYRISEQTVDRNKDQTNVVDDNYEDWNRNTKFNDNYSNRWYGNRNYNNYYGYNNNRNNSNYNYNYRMYNKFDNSYWNRNNERNADYNRYSNRDYYTNNKRKINDRYNNEEDNRNNYKSRRSNYKEYEKRRSSSRDRRRRSSSRDKKRRSSSRDRKRRHSSRDRKRRSSSRDRKHRSSSRDRKHRSSSRDRKHRSSSRDRKHRSLSRDRKHRSSSRDRKPGSSSRDRKRRSYSNESSTSSETSRSSSSDRENKNKYKSLKKSDKGKENEHDDRKGKNDENKKEKRRRNHYSSESDSDSSKSNLNLDYRLDKDGYCETNHRCKYAYDKCPYKHKNPFKENCKQDQTKAVLETKINTWSRKPSTNSTEIKVDKNDTKTMVDSTLSSYLTSTGTYYCKYCVVTTKSNESFSEHLKTQKHKLLVKLKNVI